MEQYRGKHVSSGNPWPVASTAGSSRKGRHQQKYRRHRTLWFIVAVLVLLLLLYPFLEPRLLTVDTVQIASEDLPADINRLHIVFVSDIHYGFHFSDSRLNNLISRINQLKPDIVLFGGDYATDNLTALRFLERLPSIHARYAVLGVIGEADHGESDFEYTQLKDRMRNAGIIPLGNDVRQIRVGNSSVYVAGTEDPLSGTPDLKHVASQVSASDFVILLSHNPSIIPTAQLATDRDGHLGWFDLGLFGHTHGGQIPLFSSLLGIAEDVPSRYQSGWLTENRVSLLISHGVGTSVFPVRLFCRPQIHDIEIVLN